MVRWWVLVYCDERLNWVILADPEACKGNWNYVIYMSWKKFRVWKFLYTSFFLFSPHSKRQGSGTWIVLVLLFEEGAGCSRLPTDSLLLLLLLHTPQISRLPLHFAFANKVIDYTWPTHRADQSIFIPKVTSPQCSSCLLQIQEEFLTRHPDLPLSYARYKVKSAKA